MSSPAQGEGEQGAKGEPLLEVDTDKAVVEVESPGDGILSSISAREGAVIPGTNDCRLLALAKLRQLRRRRKRGGEPTAPGRAQAAGAGPGNPTPPFVRTQDVAEGAALAREHGVDVAHLRGSGPGGEIAKTF